MAHGLPPESPTLREVTRVVSARPDRYGNGVTSHPSFEPMTKLHASKALNERSRSTLVRRGLELGYLQRHNQAAAQEAEQSQLADWRDMAAQHEAAWVLDRLAEREQRELEDIDAALDRLNRGTFGRCQRCGGPVTMQRIDAVPEARQCIRCENEKDRVRGSTGEPRHDERELGGEG